MVRMGFYMAHTRGKRRSVGGVEVKKVERAITYPTGDHISLSDPQREGP